jgi:YVTN family beta-propeller protein
MRSPEQSPPGLRSRGAGLFLGMLLSVTAGAYAGPKAYIGLFKDNAIAVLDTATNRLLSTIAIPPGPHGLVVTPDGATVFASSDGDSKVSVIDTARDAVSASIEVGTSPHGLAITPDGKVVLVAVFGASQVVFIDTTSRAIRGRVAVASPHNIAVSPDGSTAYVAAQGKGALALVVLDVPGMRQKGIVPLDKTPRALNYSADGHKLYFTLAGADAVQVLDTGSNAIVRQIAVGASPHHPLLAADGTKALVVSQGPGTLSRIDPMTDVEVSTVKVGTLPHWIALTKGESTAYVTNEGSNDVSVVDLSTMTVTATIPIGNAPRKIVIQPAAVPVSQSGVQTTIAGFAFEDPVTVRAGQTVTWTNTDSVPHTVTSDTKLWDSGDIAAGATFTREFGVAGTYLYHCATHPSMRGTVVVTPSAQG